MDNKLKIIQKRKMSDFAEFDAIRFRFDAIKNIGLLSRQEAKINFNGKPINEETLRSLFWIIIERYKILSF